MPLQVNDNYWKDYRGTVAKGEMTRAHKIASQVALLYEEGDDLKLAGFWRRAVSSTLYYLGKYGEAAFEAERSADIQPDPYERALSLILLAQSHPCLRGPTAHSLRWVGLRKSPGPLERTSS